MKETRRQTDRQLSLTLDLPTEAVNREPKATVKSSLLRFPNSNGTTSFQRKVIDQLVRTKVITK